MALRQDPEPAASGPAGASASTRASQNTDWTSSVTSVASSLSTTAPPTTFPPPPILTTTLDATTAAWLYHESKLSASERSLFLKQDRGQLGKYLAELLSDSKKQEQNSHGLRLARSVEPIVQFVETYAPIAQTVAQGAPAPAAFVVGGITCLLSVPTRFLEYQDTILEMLYEMSVEFRRLSRYQNTLFKHRFDAQTALFDVYGSILDFCREVTRFLYGDDGKPRNVSKMFARSLWKPCHVNLGEILKTFKRDLKIFDDLATQLVREEAAIAHANQAWANATQARAISNLESGMATLASGMSQLHQENAHMKGDKRDRVLAWIPCLSFAEVHREKISKRLEGTGQWLLDHKKFQLWKTGDSESGILCVQGKAGSGKSCLAALVIEHLRQDLEASSESSAIAYTYCSSLEDARWDPKFLLGSILNQIQSQVPDFAADRIIERVYDQNASKAPSVEQLEELILKVSGKLKKVFIIVDGLDECHGLDDEAFESLCKSVRSFARQTPSIAKVVVLNRPNYVFLEHVFHSYPHISVDAGENDKDIEKYISSVLSGDDYLIKSNKKLLALVEKTLLEKADGMFLWVNLLAQSLKSARSISEIRERMEKLPRDLHGVYEVALRRILRQESKVRKARALNILLWVTNAKRALSRTELMEAIAIEPGNNDLNTDTMIENDEGVTAECGDLLTVSDDHYYYPVHSSLQDYLKSLADVTPQETKDDSQGNLEEYGKLHRNANRLLGEACLTYLQFDKFRDGPIQDTTQLETFQRENPFFSYAASYWGSHVVSSIEPALQGLVDELLSCDETRELSMQQYLLTEQEVEGLCPYNGFTTPLHVLAKFNLAVIAKSWPEMHKLKYKRDSFGLTPLDYALRDQSREMCSWLLEGAAATLVEPNMLTGRYSEIHLAAFHDWGEIVEKLIAVGCDINEKVGELGQSPLHVAAAGGRQSALEALLNAKAEVDALDAEGQTPLVDAAEGNHQQAVSSLLKAGADVNRPGWQGLTALHRIAMHGNLIAARELIQYKATVDVAAGEGWGSRTAFHLAAEENHPRVLRYLHSKGAATESRTERGFTALLLAATSGNLEALNLLVELKAQLDVQTNEGDTALHLAAGNGHHEIVEVLCRPLKAFVNSFNQDGCTPLHLAVEPSQTKAAIALLEGGALTEKVDSKGQTVLHRAISEGNTELSEQLILCYKADRNAKGILGSPPLHYAAHFGHTAFIKLLTGEGGNDPDAVNDSLQTALHLAARQNNIRFIEELNLLAPDLSLGALDKYNRSPLHLAADEGASDVVKYLVDRRVPVSKNLDGNLPLHLAAWCGNLDSVKVLQTDENINEPGFLGRTALYGAAVGGHINVAKFLLRGGANVNQCDDFGQTVLYTSLKTKNVDIAELLLDNMADPTIPTRWAQTPLHAAASLGHSHICARLLKAGCNGLARSAWGDTPFYCAVESDSIELVQLFLDHQINGTGLTNYQNDTCFLYAVYHGNIPLFETLLDAGKETGADVHGEDHLQRGLMWAAASKGQVDMIDRLQALGLDINGSKGSLDPPICEAASSGYLRFISRLIELGADLELSCAHTGRTPLIIAAVGRRPLTFRRLIEAGANPLTRDKFGLNALDYARRFPGIWILVAPEQRQAYQTPDTTKRITGLRCTIRDCIRSILRLTEHEIPLQEGQRIASMITLSRCVLELEENPKDESFCVLLEECANPPEVCQFNETWACDICERSLTRDKKYMCWKCDGHSLCEACFGDYSKGGDSPRSAPKAVVELEILERELQSVRLVADAYYSYGMAFILDGLGTLNSVEDWVAQKTRLYDEWEAQYNGDNRYMQHSRPGWKFLKLIEKAQKLSKSLSTSSGIGDDVGEGGRGKSDEVENPQNEGTDGDTSSKAAEVAGVELKNNCEDGQFQPQEVNGREPNSKPFDELDKELSILCRHHRADKEFVGFSCLDNEYFEVPYIDWTKSDSNQGPHDARGKVSAEWLTNLLAKYSSDEAGVTQEQVTEILPLYAEPLEMEQLGQGNDNDPSPHSAAPKMALPKRSLTVSQFKTVGEHSNEDEDSRTDEEVARLPRPKLLSRAATERFDSPTSPISRLLPGHQLSRPETLDLLDRATNSLTGLVLAPTASDSTEGRADNKTQGSADPIKINSKNELVQAERHESLQKQLNTQTASIPTESEPASLLDTRNGDAELQEGPEKETKKDSEKHTDKDMGADTDKQIEQQTENATENIIDANSTVDPEKKKEQDTETDNTAKMPSQKERELLALRKEIRHQFSQGVLQSLPKVAKDLSEGETQKSPEQNGGGASESPQTGHGNGGAEAAGKNVQESQSRPPPQSPAEPSQETIPTKGKDEDKHKDEDKEEDEDELDLRQLNILVQMLLWRSSYEYLQAIWFGEVTHATLFNRADATRLLEGLPLLDGEDGEDLREREVGPNEGRAGDGVVNGVVEDRDREGNPEEGEVRGHQDEKMEGGEEKDGAESEEGGDDRDQDVNVEGHEKTEGST